MMSVRDAEAGCDVTVGGFVKSRPAWRECHRRRIVEANHGEWIVRGIYTLQRRIDLPSQPVSNRQLRQHAPRVLTVQRDILRAKLVLLIRRGLGKSRDPR